MCLRVQNHFLKPRLPAVAGLCFTLYGKTTMRKFEFVFDSVNSLNYSKPIRVLQLAAAAN